MALSDALRTRLLGALETKTLVFLCGAGLSIPMPSDLPKAVDVSRACYDTWQPIEALPAALRDDIDALAGHFHQRGDFQSVFINRLVPWNELAGPSNAGHAAVADLLITKAAHSALSANFDTMIERWAAERRIAMRGALTGLEAAAFSGGTSPLVKFHGCMDRARDETLWTQGQLAEPAVQERIQNCTNWMNLHLPGKHLLVVGFWTDWGYLNDVIANAFTTQAAASVTVVDPSSSADLAAKAPNLWAKLNCLSHIFEHLPASGADVLDELRDEFSKAWARRFYALGIPLAMAEGIAAVASPAALNGSALYDLRRDAEGLPYNRAATLTAPPVGAAEAALMHHELVHAGATTDGAWLRHGGQIVRVVNGAGRGLDDVKSTFREPSTIPQPDIVVCAGAADLGVPGRLIAPGYGASIMRPRPGGGALWMTRPDAKVALGI
jgi:hypothetical protein